MHRFGPHGVDMVSILRGGTRTPSCCPDLHAVHHGAGLRYRLPVQPHSFNMKLNGVRNQSAGVFQRRASSDTSRKVREYAAQLWGAFSNTTAYIISALPSSRLS